MKKNNFLDLGNQPLAINYLTKKNKFKKEKKYRLKVCFENTTKLVSIEKIFPVKVETVNTILVKGKYKRFKGVLGKRSNTKKAIVTLAPGNTIDLSAGV